MKLVQTMVDIGNGMGRETLAVISNMDQPLVRAVGNALEVKEAIEILQGKGPEDLYELCLSLGSQMLILAKTAKDQKEARKKLEQVIRDGSALEKLKEFVKAQGGDFQMVDQPGRLPQAKFVIEVKSLQEGFIEGIQAEETLLLGAGRETKDSQIDLSVGVYLLKKVGDFVEEGETLAFIHSNDEQKTKQARERLLNAYSFSEEEVKLPKLIYGLVTKKGIEEYL